MESMKKMKTIEPQVAKLKKKYAKDPKGLMQAQSELYKQKGVNPGAGCLPYILQIVVLIALFNVFTQALGGNGDSLNKFNQLLYSPLRLAEGESLNTSFLYLDVTRPDVFRFDGIPFPIPGPVLILSALLQLAVSRMTVPYVTEAEKVAKKTKGEADDMQVAMQKSMSFTFPLFTLVFGVNFPSGLAIYWLLFSVFQIWQQYKNSGWGGLTPLIRRLGLLKSLPQT